MEIQQNLENQFVVSSEKNENPEPCVELLQNLGLLGNDNLATRETAKNNLPSIIDKFSLHLTQIQDITLKELGVQKVQELSLSLLNSIRVQDKLAGIQFFKELISRNDTQMLTPNFEDKFFEEMKKLFKHQDIKIRTIISQIIGELIKFNFKKYFGTLFEFCILVGNECFQVLQTLPNESDREAIEPKNIQEISMYLEKQQMSILSEQFSSIDAILQYLCSLVNNLPKDEQFLNQQIMALINLINQLQSLEKKHLKTYSQNQFFVILMQIKF